MVGEIKMWIVDANSGRGENIHGFDRLSPCSDLVPVPGIKSWKEKAGWAEENHLMMVIIVMMVRMIRVLMMMVMMMKKVIVMMVSMIMKQSIFVTKLARLTDGRLF